MIWKRFAFFLSLFCAFGFSLILSPNQVQAYEIATPVNPTGRTWEWGNAQWWTTFNPLNTSTYYTASPQAPAIFIDKNGGASTQNGGYILNGFKSQGVLDFKEGNYYSFILNIQMNIMNTNFDTLGGSNFPSVNRVNLPSGSPLRLMSIDNSYVPCLERDTSFTSVGTCLQAGISYQFIFQATKSATTQLQVGLNNTDMIQWFFPAGTTRMGTMMLETIMEFESITMDSINQQQQQAGEQAQQDGQQGSNTSQSEAQNASTTLLGAFSGFVGAITAISPSNCNISGNFGHLDVGVLNLCQDSPPAFVATILSLVSVALLVPLSIHLAKRMIGLFRSFTNG